MHNYTLKTAILLATLFFPTITLAEGCAANDTSCAIENRQIESIKSADIKPLQATKISPVAATDSTKGKTKQSAVTAVTVQPFEIPSPDGTETKNPKDKNSTTNASTNQGENGENSTAQETTTTTKPSTGMQYR